MCGVPIHRADEYLQRLIRQGFRVAVCEQLEDPAEAQEARLEGGRAPRRGAPRHARHADRGQPARRQGAQLSDGPLRRRPEGAAASGAAIALASLDISTGEFEVGEVPAADFPGEIVRLSPGEVIAADRLLADERLRQWIDIAGAAATPVPAPPSTAWPASGCSRRSSASPTSPPFGALLARRAGRRRRAAQVRRADADRQAARACGRRARPAPANRLVIDAASRASLELLRSTSGDKRRQPARRHRPHRDRPRRARAGRAAGEPVARSRRPSLRGSTPCGFLSSDEPLREDCARALRAAPDIARAMSRLALQRGGPRDLAAVRDGLGSAAACAATSARAAAAASACPTRSPRIARAADGLLGASCSTCSPRALVDDAAAPAPRRRLRARRAIRADLDEARALRDDSRKVMAALEAQIRRGDRRQVAQGAAQQYPGLLHRGAGRRMPSRC